MLDRDRQVISKRYFAGPHPQPLSHGERGAGGGVRTAFEGIRRFPWFSIGGGAIVGGTAIFLSLLATPSYAQSPSTPSASPPPKSAVPSTVRPLRIATRLTPPDAFEQNGQIVGFSVDLGRSILKELQRDSELKTYASVSEILQAIRSGQADMGMAAIAITSQREREFDFSHPILVASLQIMVLRPEQQTRTIEQELVRRLLDPNLLRLVGLVLILMIVPAHIVWYFERGNKDGLIPSKSYIPGIFQSLWWTILALLGQTDDMPNGRVSKMVALFWVSIGIIFVAYFTATITAGLTVQEIRGDIQNLNDLRDRRVALVADDDTLKYLEDRDIYQVTQFAGLQPAYDDLLAGRVDAIVASRPLLLYYASHEAQGKVKVVGVPFREQFYAIVMPENSPYRKSINQAILTLKENGTYQEIYRQWAGVDPQD
jgi:polar amino acid transport system substrate-binding protein